MKPCEHKWTVVRKGNGKFYPRVKNTFIGAYWPWTPYEFNTLEEAKTAIMAKKASLEKESQENEETVVFELK